MGGTIPERQTGLDAFTGRGRPGPRAGLVILVILGLLAGLYWGDPP